MLDRSGRHRGVDRDVFGDDDLGALGCARVDVVVVHAGRPHVARHALLVEGECAGVVVEVGRRGRQRRVDVGAEGCGRGVGEGDRLARGEIRGTELALQGGAVPHDLGVHTGAQRPTGVGIRGDRRDGRRLDAGVPHRRGRPIESWCPRVLDDALGGVVDVGAAEELQAGGDVSDDREARRRVHQVVLEGDGEDRLMIVSSSQQLPFGVGLGEPHVERRQLGGRVAELMAGDVAGRGSGRGIEVRHGARVGVGVRAGLDRDRVTDVVDLDVGSHREAQCGRRSGEEIGDVDPHQHRRPVLLDPLLRGGDGLVHHLGRTGDVGHVGRERRSEREVVRVGPRRVRRVERDVRVPAVERGGRQAHRKVDAPCVGEFDRVGFLGCCADRRQRRGEDGEGAEQRKRQARTDRTGSVGMGVHSGCGHDTARFGVGRRGAGRRHRITASGWRLWGP